MSGEAAAGHSHDYRRLGLLFICGFSILFWELVLIRWLGTNIRVVAYFTNFALIAAFFGLGTGALLSRFRWKLDKWLAPAIALVLMSVLMSHFLDVDVASVVEHVWTGTPDGVFNALRLDNAELVQQVPLNLRMLMLISVYLLVAAVFTIFGQILGALFSGVEPIRAYSAEVAGSLAGIAVFFLLSSVAVTPTGWFIVGFLSIIPLLQPVLANYSVAGVVALLVILGTYPIVESHVWSPYYKIGLQPITGVQEAGSARWHSFDRTIGYQVTVNNDFHQMMLDLGPRSGDHEFVSEWRGLYEFPYRHDRQLPAGPILIVGAGTGNDVAAALRRTSRQIVAVEIDPAIQHVGELLHPERPYASERVLPVLDDARSFFTSTNDKFAMVVFGFLDSHTLLSSYSSLRLDNFVYTREALEQARNLLLPGGKLALTFTVIRPWQHERFLKLLSEVFGRPPIVGVSSAYVNGVVYEAVLDDRAGLAPPLADLDVAVPSDDWPFLYLASPTIPGHYLVFMAVVIALGSLTLFLLPAGQRSIRLPYFFLGAAFFLLETSNVVNLSLLYGSTWTVNAVVFAGILVLILAGNFTSLVAQRIELKVVLILLSLNLVISYLVPTGSLLLVEATALRALLAVMVFLGPIYFAALAFAILIRNESRLYQAYGSNLLGAVIGGASEYLSLMLGFKSLLLLALVFYLIAFLAMGRERAVSQSAPV